MNTREDFTGPVNIGNPQEISILDAGRKNYQYDRIKFKNNF
jgi:hypothetical protein